MATSAFTFQSIKAGTPAERFDEFVSWAEPQGAGGFNRTHAPEYSRDTPWFEYSARLLPHSHASARSWFVKQEHIGRRGLFGRALAGETPTIKMPEALIQPGRFLRFAKAYVNVYCEIRGVRSAPKASITALIFVEKALRDQNEGDNDPSGLCHLVFQRAALAIKHSDSKTKFDVGKALEHLSLLVQTGGRFRGDKRHASFPGFNLLDTSFAFRSPIKAPPRFGKARSASARRDLSDRNRGQLTSEEVAAVGMAYRRAIETTGPESVQSFFAAVTGLTLTTASMRASELQLLRADALYTAAGDPPRTRLRIPRPKIGIEQDVPVSRRLSALAHELFDVVSRCTAEAREAISFYVAQSPESPMGIHTLFIPRRLKPLLRANLLTRPQVCEIMGIPSPRGYLPRRLKHLPQLHFVRRPGDIFGPRPYADTQLVQIRDIAKLCVRSGIKLNIPEEATDLQYISMPTARSWISSTPTRRVAHILRMAFQSSKAKTAKTFVPRDALCDLLLRELKSLSFPHWPYASKERSVRLDDALIVFPMSAQNVTVEPGWQKRQWWLPNLLSMQILNRWISSGHRHPPLLFQQMGVQLSDGSYPRISIHRTRKFHHTAALLAGASAPFIDELAGRQSGWQSEHYDYRTPREILLQSIDTFDPDDDFTVVGPVAGLVPKQVIERKVFLVENAAPKHVTEIGGCRTDWSLNPCHQFGDCMRCDSHVWRKGDVARLATIGEIRDTAAKSISVGRSKLRRSPRLTAIEKQVRQLQETVDRCDEILRIEADETVSVGTIVTFHAAPSAMSDAELRTHLIETDDDRFGVDGSR